MEEYRDLLTGLNLVQQKSWQANQLDHYFPDLKYLWAPFLAARHPPLAVSSAKWATLERLQKTLLAGEYSTEAKLLARRLEKVASYFQEVEKPYCDEHSLQFFLQDLPLLSIDPSALTKIIPSSEIQLSSLEAQALMDQELQQLFPDEGVKTILSHATLARASTTKRGIRLRKDVTYTRKEVHLLIVHEAWVHLGSNLMGARQSELPWLAQWHPGVTGLQEGLALIAEIITNHWDEPRRGHVLLRHEAALQALKGAHARKIWSFLCDHGLSEVGALEVTLRIFRGCDLSGGMVFGKEFQYLLGLHQWLLKRADVTAGDMLIALSGKMDFVEWETLRQDPLGKKLKLPSPPLPLLDWMNHSAMNSVNFILQSPPPQTPA